MLRRAELGGPFAQLRITGANSRDVGLTLAESLLSSECMKLQTEALEESYSKCLCEKKCKTQEFASEQKSCPKSFGKSSL